MSEMRMGTDGFSLTTPSQPPLINGTETSSETPIVDNKTSIIQKIENYDASTLAKILQLLSNNHFQDVVVAAEKEGGKVIEDSQQASVQPSGGSTNDSNVLSMYTSEGDPETYEEIYSSLFNFVENSLDTNKYELTLTFFPIFVHMYLELVYNGHEALAIKFMRKFGPKQEEYYQEDIHVLSTVTRKEHMLDNRFQDNFKTGQFQLRMARDTYKLLKQYLHNNQNKVLQSIVQEHMFIDFHEGTSRTKEQIYCTAGSLTGEASRQANKTKIYYGLLKEPDLPISLEEEEEGPESEDKPSKKKKAKKDPILAKKARTDPNSPALNRIPLPELRDADKLDKMTALREATKRVKLGPDVPPSICFYTLLNCSQTVTSIQICEDSTLISVGFADSLIKIWTLTSNKLRSIKSASELELIDKEAEDVLYRIMDERTATDMKTLYGHSGPVYATSFSPDKAFLVSCSEDTTVRLWSLHTWTNIVCYRGHCFPVWGVKFSPHGHYFVSCGHDRTARVWTIDNANPVRILAGHSSDVDCCVFHPNSNYIATGSSDRIIRLWDMLTGACVRFLNGHKKQIFVLVFSPCGRFLASSGADNTIYLWDIANAHLLASFLSHTSCVYTLAFSREGSILASGGLDKCVKLWNVAKLFEELDLEDLNYQHGTHVRTNAEEFLLNSFPTKSTSVLELHFTQRNLLLASGMFQS